MLASRRDERGRAEARGDAKIFKIFVDYLVSFATFAPLNGAAVPLERPMKLF